MDAIEGSTAPASAPGTTPETITVFTNGSPVALTPGRWYLAVTNADPAVAVTYSIRATGILAAMSFALGNAAAVSNYVYQSSSTNRGVDYYLFRVSSNAYQATFETFSTGDVDLYVRKGLPCPIPTSLTMPAPRQQSGDERIDIRTNTSPSSQPGDWYIAVYQS